MKKISIARALKEKNRLVGKINEMYALLNQENGKSVSISLKPDTDILSLDIEKMVSDKVASMRKIDVADVKKNIEILENKLIDLKVKLTHANDGAADILVRLTEAKSKLTRISNLPVGDNNVDICQGNYIRGCNYVYDRIVLMEEVDQWKQKINELQDKIDEYNATHFIEIED